MTDPCKNFTSDFAKHPDDYYSTTSCVNCHQSKPKIETTDPICQDYLPRPSPCTAEIRWPEYLQTSIRDIERYPWWINQNFLSTKMSKDAFPITPKKLDVGIVVYLNSGQKIPLSGTDLELHAEDDSLVRSNFIMAGQGQGMNILLENQDIFSIENLSAHLNSPFKDFFIPRNTLETLSVRDGHLILSSAYGYRNLFRSSTNRQLSPKDLNDLVLPLLPVAYHKETGKSLTFAEFEVLPFKEKKNYERFPILYETARDQRLPERLRIQDLYQLIQDFQDSAQKAKKHGAPPPNLAKLSALLSSISLTTNLVPEEISSPGLFARFRDIPNANAIQLSLSTQGILGLKTAQASGNLNLEELFIPGIAHLANTTASVKLGIDTKGKSFIDVDQISSDINPIDYFKTNPRKLGILEVAGGTVKDGVPTVYQGISFAPGIHLATENQEDFTLQVNLNVSLKIKLPLVGELEVQSPLLVQTSLKKVVKLETDALGNQTSVSKLYLVPQSTLVALTDLQLKKGDQVISGSLQVSDQASSANGTALLKSAPGNFLATIDIKDISQGSLKNGKWEVSVPLPKTSDGYYDLESFIKLPELETALLFARKDNTQMKGGAALKTTVQGPRNDYKISISLDQLNDQGTKVIDPWIQNGLLSISSQQKSNKSEKHEIKFSADNLWLEPFDVAVKSPKIDIAFTENRIENQLFDWTIHKIDISGNPYSSKFPKRGILRGPFYLKTFTRPNQEIVLLSDQNAHSLKVSNLSLGFDFNRVVPPGLRAGSDGKISSVDVDGRIAGYWTMDTESYTGKGKIVFRGDKQGDIFLRDSRGRRIEARLNPQDPDRLYEIPLLADSTWTIDRIDGIDTDRERINGHFLLTTLVDYMVFQIFGINWNEHDEVTFEYDHQPYTAKGFETKIGEFFQQVSEEQKKEDQKAKGKKP